MIAFIKLAVLLTIVKDVPSLTIINDDPSLTIINEESRKISRSFSSSTTFYFHIRRHSIKLHVILNKFRRFVNDR